MKDLKPPLCSQGHVLCLSAGYHLLDNGSGVVMRNLLSNFDANSYSAGTMDVKGSIVEGSEMPHIYNLMSRRTGRARLNNVLFDAQYPTALHRLKKIIKGTRAKVIIGVYPTYHFLKLARDAAKATQIPWVAYLHDTVVEHLADTSLEARARILQQQTFAEASAVLVMSEGMSDLYRDKWKLSSTPLEHSYPEAIAETLVGEAVVEQALWGGTIYHINSRSLSRISQALERAALPLQITTRATIESLQHWDINGPHINIALYPTRSGYLEALKQQRILVLALNWPDETTMDEGELATIFPTKTIEYLASGRPIIVHCPENYFLARFFQRHGCGLVVKERSPQALDAAIRQLRQDNEAVRKMRQAALSTAQMFAASEVAARFKAHVEAVAQLSWGEKMGTI